MYEEIPRALQEAEENSDILFVVLTGSGDYFSSGNDLSNYMKPSEDPEADIIKGSRYLE